MPRLIDADALMKALNGVEVEWYMDDNGVIGDTYDTSTVVDIIAAQSTIESEPVKHGRWVMKETMVRSPYAKNAYCSECLEETSFHHNYCPNCGAKMRGEE